MVSSMFKVLQQYIKQFSSSLDTPRVPEQQCRSHRDWDAAGALLLRPALEHRRRVVRRGDTPGIAAANFLPAAALPMLSIRRRLVADASVGVGCPLPHLANRACWACVHQQRRQRWAVGRWSVLTHVPCAKRRAFGASYGRNAQVVGIGACRSGVTFCGNGGKPFRGSL